MSIKEDFKNLNAMVQTMDSQMGMLEELNNTTITDVYGLDIKMKDVISNLSVEEIDNMTEDDALDYLTEGFTSEGDNTNISSLEELQMENDTYKNEPFVSYVKYVFTEIKNGEIEMQKLRDEKDKLLKEVSDISDNYFNYVNSAEYKEKKLKRIEEMRKQADNEENLYKKNKIIKMLTAMEKSENLQFLFDRVESLGDKEVENIKNTFFDNKKSTLIMEKFSAKLPKFGYNTEIYKKFFNLEEKFLPEEYYKFNNVFLFHVMRFISYADINSKEDNLYVSSLLIKLYNLLYHRYESQEMEDEIVNVIKRFDDYFKPYADHFEKYNTTSPLHPQRIQKDKEFEEKRRLMIIASLQNEGIEPDTSLETEELRKMLQDVIDKKSNESVGVQEFIEPDIVEVKSDDTNETVSEDVEKEENVRKSSIDDMDVVNVMDQVSTAEDMHKVLETLDNSEEVEDFEDFLSDISESLHNEMDIKEDLDLHELTNSESIEVTVDAVDTPVEDSSFVVKRQSNETDVITHPVVEKDVEETTETEVEIYKDMYNCYYIEDNGTYAYLDENNEIIEEGIKEDTILQLLSTNSIRKEIVKL